MPDDRPKRPGVFADDDERATIGADRRRRVHTPAAGVPIHAPEPDDFTPVGSVLPLAEDEGMRIMLAKIWQHTANSEMRLLAAISRTEGSTLRLELDELANAHNLLVERITDATGKSGDNGKLGELRRIVAEMKTRTWWLITFLLGALGTAAIKLVIVVRAFDAVEARSVANVDQIKILQAQVMTLQAAAISRGAHRERPPGQVEAGRESP